MQTKSLEYIAVSKFMPITYMCTVFVFIFGFVLLGEVVYITDIIGAGLIISFQLYNTYYPPGRQVNEQNINEINKGLISSINNQNNEEQNNRNDNEKN